MKYIYNNLHYLKLFTVSITFLLITGPFFSDLLVSLSSIAFLTAMYINKEYKYFKNKPFIFFLIFCIYCSLNSLFNATEFLLSFKSSFFYIRIGIFSILIWYLIENEKNFLKYFYYVLLFCFVCLICDGYLQFFYGKNILGFKLIQNYRITSFFDDQLILGSYLTRLFPIFIALFIIKEKKQYEIYIISSLIILLSILIFLSGERTSFFYFILASLFMVILIKNFLLYKILIFSIVLILITTVALNKSEIYDRMIVETSKNLNLELTNEKKYIFSKIHESHLKTAINMFLTNPIVGHGPKMFRIKCSDDHFKRGNNPCSTHPHNFYIQLLAETGLIGFSFLFMIFLYVSYATFTQLKSIIFHKEKRYLNNYQICLLAGILITVWPFSPNGNFFNNWLSILYSLPFGFYLQTLYTKKKLIKF